MINELRTERDERVWSRVEFVEFRMLSAGNLEGVRVFIYRAGTRVPMVFEFPSVEVQAGEFAVLYLRTPLHEITDTEPTAHNFWLPGSSSWINKNSAIYVLDPHGRVLNAVMTTDDSSPSWWTGNSRGHFAEIAGVLFERGAWKSRDGGVATAADAVNIWDIRSSTTRSVSRDETVPNTNTMADWYITANNGVSPGLPNYPGRF